MKEMTHALKQSLQISVEELDDVLKKSEMQVSGCSDLWNEVKNPLSMHFSFADADVNSRIACSTLVNRELSHRKSSQSRSLHECDALLKNHT